MKIGVLALQGAVREHIHALQNCGAEAIPIKKTDQLNQVNGLIIPGGESTTVGKLMVKYGFMEAIKNRVQEGMPVFGTCTGLIVLAKRVFDSNQPTLGLLDVTVVRNAFGRQVDSFETDITVKGFSSRFPAIFIRAPYVKEVGPSVEVLSIFADKIVFVKENRILGAAFHPELTHDLRIHQMFLELCKG